MDKKKVVYIIGGAIPVVLFIIVIAVIVFLLLARFVPFIGNLVRRIPWIGPILAGPGEDFTLRNPTFEEIYKNSVTTIVDRALTTTNQYLTLGPEKSDEFRANTTLALDAYFTEMKGDQNAIVNGIGDKLSEICRNALKGEEIPKELILYFDTSLPDSARHYLTYFQTKLQLPSVGNGKIIVNDMESLHNKRDKLITSLDENPINLEVNKDMGQHNMDKFRDLNVTNLIAGIKRHGHSAGIKRQTSVDIRGRPRGLVEKLSKLHTTRDPNSLLRSGNWSVYDVLVSSKGLTNVQMHDEALDHFNEHSGRPEARTYNYIKNRVINRDLTPSEQIMNNTMINIKKDIQFR